MFFFFNNILLMWKIVGASKVSVLYVYIDYQHMVVENDESNYSFIIEFSALIVGVLKNHKP